jgi:tRNA (guanine-N7-)-methyltransferase
VRKTRRLPPEELAPYLLEVPDPPRPLTGRAIFGNDHPVELEVGFGKGLFLLTAAQACPEVNFLGIEIVRKYQLYAATRMAVRKLSNVRLACTDARAFLRDCLAGEVLRAIHVYFPDPWWKKRHHKRRVFTAEFARQCERTLEFWGELHLVSDVEEYFQVMTGLVATETGLQAGPPPEASDPKHDLDYLTNFERKFRKEGRPIYRARYVRPQVVR